MLRSAPSSWHLMVRSSGGATVVRLIGNSIYLHETDAECLRASLSRLAEKAGSGHLFIDLGDVVFLTSSTVEALLALRRRLHVLGGQMTVCNPTPVVREILAALKLDQLFDVHTGPAGEPVDD